MQAACALDVLYIGFDPDHALLNETPVGFDLRFTRTTEKAEATALALKMGPGADKTALLVGKMGEFDLERAFACAGASAEDFEDETRAINDLDPERLFQIALLHGAERAIGDHEVNILIFDHRCQFLDLAFAEIG